MVAAKKRRPVTKTGVTAKNKAAGAKAEKRQVNTASEKVAPAETIKVTGPKTATSKKPAKKPLQEDMKLNRGGITKKYLTREDACAVTFRLPKAAVAKAKTVCIVGDFNNWNIYADPMKRCKDGTYSIELELAKGKEYQFRYLIDDCRWENDWNADKYVRNPFGDSDNSVVVV